jgi:ATP-binding cassette subfamily C (CFTR/MRP) protein 1
VIPQNGFLFSGSLLQNLNPKRNLTPTQVISFLKQHHLLSNRLLEIVAAGQIETYHIESGGANLSNGEKQIINFVQQVLEIKDIVCMDEATSNMDP